MVKRKNSWKDYMLLHGILLFYSLGSVFSKFASGQTFFSWRFLLAYGMVLFIMFGYAVVWQQILKRFDLTVAFTNKAIVIAWGIIWGMILFEEKIKWNMIVGAIVIVFGILMVAKEDEC